MVYIFWICIAIVFYTFIGYGLLMYLCVKIKHYAQIRHIDILECKQGLPSCTVIIAAYNEEEWIEQKILNTLSLDYPKEILKVFVVADGSTDKTASIVKKYEDVELLYSVSRQGKVHAINRAMTFVNTDVVVFTDANTFLNTDALAKICVHYSDSNVGGVAGEKKIRTKTSADAASAGESIYWKYESKLKELDSTLNTTIGAAGELFSIRRNLFEPIPDDTILDDFLISMKIAQRGFRIVYEPRAYAIESASTSVKEELKRKIRISAGGIQSIVTLRKLLNPRPDPLLSFQYISHRVLRWSIVPFLLIISFLINGYIALEISNSIYPYLFFAQLFFYLLAFVGFVLERKQLSFKLAFVPYYFCVMNFAVIAGIIRYLRNGQSSIWEKSSRKNNEKSDTPFVLN